MVADTPLPPAVEKSIEEIKSLKVQGARNVAIKAINTIKEVVESYKGKDKEELLSLIAVSAFRLMNARPTEPMARETLRNVLQRIVSLAQQDSVEEIKAKLQDDAESFLEKMEENLRSIAEIGSNLLPEDAIVMTYCHSSTVVAILKEAHRKGKLKEVFSCETRPLYQGHITAKELAREGINVKTIVDGASSTYMEDVDAVIVGADAIQADGSLINKIGTHTLAIVANEYNVPFYSAAELSKYDALTVFGFGERIEHRDPAEVWANPPKGVHVLNPAFDITPAKYIHSYITEAGMATPQRLPEVFEKVFKG